ncbi:hypothetical protein Syun_000576 [Stephania yunnanensis]|uniref:Uncharacterized protein n=1 Tax=Stephania yunnanensis TaxID=152371 RepID=A0AAP0LCG9_9MAGN
MAQLTIQFNTQQRDRYFNKHFKFLEFYLTYLKRVVLGGLIESRLKLAKRLKYPSSSIHCFPPLASLDVVTTAAAMITGAAAGPERSGAATTRLGGGRRRAWCGRRPANAAADSVASLGQIWSSDRIWPKERSDCERERQRERNGGKRRTAVREEAPARRSGRSGEEWPGQIRSPLSARSGRATGSGRKRDPTAARERERERERERNGGKRRMAVRGSSAARSGRSGEEWRGDDAARRWETTRLVRTTASRRGGGLDGQWRSAAAMAVEVVEEKWRWKG